MKKSYLVVVCFLMSSCSPVKGYIGPDLPPEQVSLVKTTYDSDQLEVGTATVNGIEFYSAGITVLPGKQNFNLSITVKEEPFDCETYSTLDYDSYRDCRKKKDSSCDCYDYLTVWKKCYREVHDGQCQGTVSTAAGGQYQIALYKDAEGATVSVLGPSASSPGKGKCSTSGRRIDKDEESLGTGKYTAQSNGIYYCH